ncbi:hypothetical protein AB4039_00685 [Streptomyces sp. M-16]|uniref:hypothetical protein n=1 Tax=Streptomyces sp. M-16 TaxID=3233040 RepID=UPI00225B9E65
MRIVIEDVPDQLGGEIALGIVELVARHTPVTHGSQGITVHMQCDWTPERAAHLLRDLPLRAIGVVRHVVEGSGWADVETLRGQDGDGLWKGFTTTLTSAVARGARRGLWPSGIRIPLTPTTHPDGDRRIRGYAMPCEAVTVFARALESTEPTTARGDVP